MRAVNWRRRAGFGSTYLWGGETAQYWQQRGKIEKVDRVLNKGMQA
jgi:hypothetical protein